MRLNDIGPGEGARREPKRVGRGIGSGLGKTGGRGHKGHKSRSGGGRKAGFEGGQMPLKQRVPKLKGFTNPFRVEYTGINLDTLQGLADDGETKVTPEMLQSHGLVRSDAFVKILGRGEVSSKLDVHAHAISKSADAAIKEAGGSVTLIELPFRAEGKAGRPAAKGNQFTNR